MDRTSAPGYVTNAAGQRQYADLIPGETPGTSLIAFDRTAAQEEVVGAIEASGQTPSAANNGQLAKAISIAVAAEATRAEAVEATLVLKSQLLPTLILVQSANLEVPVWATRAEFRAIGGGGGGATSNAIDTSGSFAGSGGGAGGDALGFYAVTPGSVLNVTIGAGGAQQAAGGASSVAYNGNQIISAQGGLGATFYATQGSAGAQGGAASGGTIWNQTGGWGGDGQSGTSTFSGYGANGPFGGGGRAGSQGGMPGTHFGAGGGGAYGQKSSGSTSPGGAGYQGCVLYRFLP